MCRSRSRKTLSQLATPATVGFLPLLASITDNSGSWSTSDAVIVVIAMVLLTLAELLPVVLAHQYSSLHEQNRHIEVCRALNMPGAADQASMVRLVEAV